MGASRAGEHSLSLLGILFVGTVVALRVVVAAQVLTLVSVIINAHRVLESRGAVNTTVVVERGLARPCGLGGRLRRASRCFVAPRSYGDGWLTPLVRKERLRRSA